MRHNMKLQTKPFEAIANGSKTIELRLFDEKRQQVRAGDEIEFTELSESKRKVLTKVVALHHFPSFKELYNALSLDKCGYSKSEINNASPEDMDAYYPIDKQKQYGVIGIELMLVDVNEAGTVTIETENLILRRFTMDDAESMFRNWASDSEVTKYLSWTPHKDVSETLGIISEWIKEYNDPNRYQWAIELKSIGEPIGSIGVVRYAKEKQSAEIGYCIGKAFWHKGYTSEALVAVLNYLFKTTDFNRIFARHDVRNPNSGKVMLKSGMKYEGTLREAGLSNSGERISLSVCSILRSEWEMNN